MAEPRERVILHCDCNGFFASVETLLDPTLASVPMVVTGDPESRHGIILAKNEKAKKYGIQTAETIWQAKQKCPNLVCVLPHHNMYGKISKKVNAIYLDYTDLVDPFGIDESFLDVTGSLRLFGKTPKELADHIRERVKREIGITVSVGVSFCRVFAKLGSDYKKPDATTVIDRDNYKEIAYPLPVSAMLFAGKRTTQALGKMGIFTIGDLAAADRKTVVDRLGEAGDTLWRYAAGLDEEPVHTYWDRPAPKSVGNGMTFRRDIAGADEIRAGVTAMADLVAARLREIDRKCTVVQVQIKDPNFRTVQRQCTLRRATWLQQEIVSNAMALIAGSVGFGASVRALTVTASGLVSPGDTEEQLDMFSATEPKNDKQETIEKAMADIREKHGRTSIHLGCYENPAIGTGKNRKWEENSEK
ncbi:MAG: DNA polymerase IV [Ruminococcaceae bacterium]|nr:DNA polymerase IV [Oscillospiraceae bacterium]